jgi:hypothetical protein
MEAECRDDVWLHAVWVHSVLTEVNKEILYTVLTAAAKGLNSCFVS